MDLAMKRRDLSNEKWIWVRPEMGLPQIMNLSREPDVAMCCWVFGCKKRPPRWKTSSFHPAQPSMDGTSQPSILPWHHDSPRFTNWRLRASAVEGAPRFDFSKPRKRAHRYHHGSLIYDVWIHIVDIVTCISKYYNTGWWFGTFLFFHILGIIIPIDFHIFQRGRYTTNQNMI